MKGSAISTFVILITIVVMVGQGEAAINCGQVEAFLTPCVPYLTIGGPPGLLCCGGVQSIKGMAITPEDKRTACNCVKAAAIRYPTLKDDAAQALPQRCGVKLDIPISRSSNCDIIN